MPIIYCADTLKEIDVSLSLHIPGKGYCADILPKISDNFAALDGFVISSGSEMFPSSCEGDVVTTEPQVNAFLALWEEEVKRANAGKPTMILPQASKATPGEIVDQDIAAVAGIPTTDAPEWVLDIEEEGGGCFDLPLSDLTDEQLAYLFQHSSEWHLELTDELIRRADMEDEESKEAQEPDPDFERIWFKAADKLHINLIG